MKIVVITSLLIAGFSFSSVANPSINEVSLLEDIKQLSSDEMYGRKPNTAGSELAQQYIIDKMQRANLIPFYQTYLQPFEFSRGLSTLSGSNIIGWIEGQSQPDKYIVFTAHYDHLGKKKGRVYNGANDNASGVAAILAIASTLSQNPPQHSVIFVATDAEEYGLHGAKAFIGSPPIDTQDIVLNINLDMIASPTRDKCLHVIGSRQYPEFKPVLALLVEQDENCIHLRQPRNSRTMGKKSVNWLKASDHGVFHSNNIPFLYFGVAPNSHYHSSRDTFENINQPFYLDAVRSVLFVFEHIDQG